MRRLRFGVILALSAFGILGLTKGAEGRPDRVLFDFESGTFEGWQADGEPAFGDLPVRPDHDMQPQHDQRKSYRFSGWEGDYMVSQDIMLSKRRGIRETQVPGGRLISEAFLIDRDYLNFKLGGLLHPEVYVSLVLEEDEKPVKEGDQYVLSRQTHANNRFDLVWRGWDVKDLQGKTARIHLNAHAANRILFRADHFVLSDLPVPRDRVFERTHWLDTPVVLTGEFKLLFSAAHYAPAFKNATLLKGHDGRWHVFAEECKNNNGYFSELNNLIYHSSAAELTGSWDQLTPVLVRDVVGGEAWMRDPLVVFDRSSRRYVMLYWGTGIDRDSGPFGVCAATSIDGVSWQRESGNPIFAHDFAPLLGSIVWEGGEWILFYSNHGEEAVAVDRVKILFRRSLDLLDWGEPEELSVTSADGQSVGYSRPVFFKRKSEWFMLSNNQRSQQGRTRFLFSQVYSGPDLFRWDLDSDYRGNLNVFFAPQVFEDEVGEWQIFYWHVTSGGPWIAPLRFDDQLPRPTMPTGWPGIPLVRD